jgi:hypothetical protein
VSDLAQWLTGKLNELAPGYPPITVVVQDESQQIFAAGAGVPACQAVLLSTRRPCGGTRGVRLADSGCQNEHMQRLRLCARCRADGINWCKSCFEVTGGDLGAGDLPPGRGAARGSALGGPPSARAR